MNLKVQVIDKDLQPSDTTIGFETDFNREYTTFA